MSQAELRRFASAVQETPVCLDAYRTVATAGEMAAQMRRDGYDVTDAEVEETVRRGGDLTDEDLDHVAGGSLVAIGIVGGCLLGLGLAVAGTVSTVILAAKGHQTVDW